MNWYDVYVVIRMVEIVGGLSRDAGHEERFVRTVRSASGALACRLVRIETGHPTVIAKRTPLRRVFKNWLVAMTYGYWPNRAFSTEYYYLATGMEGIADERSLGVVHARCRTEARHKATIKFMRSIKTTTDYDWYHGCISAKPVRRFM